MSKDTYKALKNETTLDELEILIKFWYDVKNQDLNRFSDKVLQLLFVLNYAPNGMWYYFVSVYFMHNKQSDGSLEENAFLKFWNEQSDLFGHTLILSLKEIISKI